MIRFRQCGFYVLGDKAESSRGGLVIGFKPEAYRLQLVVERVEILRS